MTMENTAPGAIQRGWAALAPMVPAGRTAKEDATPDFLAAYPGYAATFRLDELRAGEYSYLDVGGHTYLDYTGGGLVADGQLRAHAERIRGGFFGNPHSESPTSNASTRLIVEAKAAVLRYFNAAVGEYAVIFTQNATGACRLVGEAYQFRPLSRFVLTADNHNSVNGMREFAYPAQSNFSGVQHPLAWVDRAHAAGYDVLLDAAASPSPRGPTATGSPAGKGRRPGCAADVPGPLAAGHHRAQPATHADSRKGADRWPRRSRPDAAP
jgi:hypothetical protein